MIIFVQFLLIDFKDFPAAVIITDNTNHALQQMNTAK